MLSRHPELARKMKANSAGERVLDEEAMMTAGAILRKENRAPSRAEVPLPLLPMK